MKRVVPSVIVVTLLIVVTAWSQTSQGQDSVVTPGAHSALFAAPRSEEAVSLTKDLTADMETPQPGSVRRVNFIDDYIFGKMDRDKIPHAPLSTDREFVRRVRLDLTGRIPTPEELRAFLADPSPDKRARLIDRLVDSPEFTDKWAYFLMDTLRVAARTRGTKLFHYYLKQSIAADRPYSDLVRSIISSAGKSNLVVAAVNEIVREHVEGKPGQVDNGDDLRKIQQQDTDDELTVQFGKVFLGINMSCISCHDGRGHLEKVNAYLAGKKRSDFFQEAAFMGQTRYIMHVEKTELQVGHHITDELGAGYDTKGDTMLRIPRNGGPNTPKFLLTDQLVDPQGGRYRTQLAEMITTNPQFARATTNLFWSRMMGFGIVDPVDEFDLARQDPDSLPKGWDVQPSHPELLNKLGVYFSENNYSLKKLFKLIANSSAYQLSARFPGEWNDTYTRYYARKYVRMLGAEELHDAVVMATGVPGNFPDGGGGMVVTQQYTSPLAMQVADPRPKDELAAFMKAFGHSNRRTVSRPPTASPLQPIIMMESPVVGDRVLATHNSHVQKLLATGTNEHVIDEMFLATLSRVPSPPEKDFALLAMAKDRVRGAENLQWVLLNLAEFLYNF
jgi:hypothetical protein